MRPILRYHGGKWMLAPWIISHFPSHRVYVEPFGGGASCLLRKDRSYAEIYNDLDGEIVNLFRVVRDHGDVLREKLVLTPYAREEFALSWQPSEDPMEQARRTVVRSFMGFSSNSASRRATGFRSNSNRSGTTPAHDWVGYSGTGFRTYSGEQKGRENRRTLPSGDWQTYESALTEIITRLQGVVIENKDAKLVMADHDGERTLHYVDPPYLPETRDKGDDYAFEMSQDDHRQLAIFLRGLIGAVIVSGYPSEMYDELYAGWSRVQREALADGAGKRVEVLWINHAAQLLMPQKRLFAHAD